MWTTPRLRGTGACRPLPWLERFADARVTLISLRVFGVLLLAGSLVVAWVGPDDDGRGNPAPTWLYV